jgi:hypothetical protein
MPVDAEKFGEVKALSEQNEKRLDHNDTRFDKLEAMIMRLTYLVIANMAGGIGAMVYGSEAKNAIIAMIGKFISTANAFL